MKYYKVDERIHLIPQKTLSWIQKLFYSRLDFRCNHKNLSWWSKKKLAKDFQTTPRNIQRWWWRLEKLGLITIHQEVGSENEISINELTDELLNALGVPPMSREGRHGCLGRGDTGVSPYIKGKVKMKKKTGSGRGKAPVRYRLEEVFEDSDVNAAGSRAVEASKKRGAARCIPSMKELRDPPPEDGVPVPDEQRLARWSKKDWSDAFVSCMTSRGYEVAYAKYRAIQNHIGAIRDHLLNRGFSRLKIHRFLLKWFPSRYTDLASSVFKKNPEDFMFSVAWMEPRLDELVRRFEDTEQGPRKGPKVTVMD